MADTKQTGPVGHHQYHDNHQGHHHNEPTHDNKHEEHHDNDDLTKGEKKIKKALLKLGLNKVEGVNRVTIRQKDNYILVVKDPEVYFSKESDSSYVIFGEITIDDPDKPKTANELENIAKGPQLSSNSESKPVEIVDDDAPVSEEGLDQDSINMIIEETKCSRQKAAKALKKHNGDVVNAILEINN